MSSGATCHFYNIGQGLFYSGELFNDKYKVFCFVYDCGTMYKKDKERLRNAIDHCYVRKTGETTELDALFISHFDLDHISGVPYLLEKHTVKNVFIPYFTPESLKLLALKNAENVEEAEIFQLYDDPVAFFVNHGCEHIYILHPMRMDKNRKKIFDENSDFSYEGDGERTSRNGSVSIHTYYGEAFFRIFRHDWEFHIYQDQVKVAQEKIQKDIQSLLPKNVELTALLTDENLRKRAKALYNSVKGGINQSSMVLYHGPCKSEGRHILYAPVYSSDYNVLGVKSGTLLTGDLNLHKLRDDGQPFTQFVVNQSQEIGVLQLPHHGSRKSISINQIAKIIPYNQVVMICSYGRGNQFRHPDPYTLDKLIETCGCPIIHVNESRNYDYGIEMPFWI